MVVYPRVAVVCRPSTQSLISEQATSAYVPNQKLPYSEQWNLGVQHMFAKNYTAEVRYVGTRGIHLSVQDRLNRQAVVTSQQLPTHTSRQAFR